MISTLFNPTTLYAQKYMNLSQGSLSQSLQRMSSGLKIINAKDDAAGTVISSKMNVKLNGINTVQKNNQQAVNMLSTAEGALNNMQDIATRIRDLSLQSMNGTYSLEERQAMQDEIKELNEELYRVKNTTTFGNLQVLGKNEKCPAIIKSPIANSTTSAINTRSLDNTSSATSTAKMMMRTASPMLLANAEPTIEISSAQDLKNLTSVSGTVVLKNNIDLTGIDIGGINIESGATFDGNGYTITGYSSDKALFNTNDGTIKNLTIKDGKVNATTNNQAIMLSTNNGLVENCNVSGEVSNTGNYTGVAIGYQNASGITRNVDVLGEVKGQNSRYVGILIGSASGEISNCNTLKGSVIEFSSLLISSGLIGETNNAKISNCSVDIINSSDLSAFFGGLVGYCNNSEINNCEISGNNTGIDNCGGAFGAILNSKVQNTKANFDLRIGNSTSAASIGGFAGRANDTIFLNCASTGNIECNCRYTGGFAGTTNNSTYENCYATGNVKNLYSGGYTAGFATLESTGSTIKNCYSTGDVESVSGNASGFVNSLSGSGSIENCFSSGTVTATGQADAFCNTVSSNIKNCYSSSTQSGNVTNKNASVTQQDESWFKNGFNLTFMGDGYDYRYNPPKFKADSTYSNIQIGENAGVDNTLSIDLGLELGEYCADVTSAEKAEKTLKETDNLIDKISAKLSDIGATLNRLDSIEDLQNINIENLSQAKSLITDTDMAFESMNFVRNNILNQVANSIFTQANTQNSGLIMSLLNFGV